MNYNELKKLLKCGVRFYKKIKYVCIIEVIL